MKRRSAVLLLLAAGLSACALLNPSSTPTIAPTFPPPQTAFLPTATPPPEPPGPAQVAPITPTLAAGLPIARLSAGTPFTLQQISMLNAADGWAIGGTNGAGDHVLRTRDGGLTWRDVTPPQPEGKMQTALGYFGYVEAAWVVYSPPTDAPSGQPASLWRTLDGGEQWSLSQPLAVEDLNNFSAAQLQFIDLQSGWLLAHVGVGLGHDYVALFQTSDGGITWQRILDPMSGGSEQSCLKTGLYFADASQGWLSGDCGGMAPGVFLYHTADGGHTWQPLLLPSPESAPGLFINATQACAADAPHLFGPQVGRLHVRCTDYGQQPATNSEYVYATGDGGQHWQASPFPGGKMFFISPATGWALGAEIYRTGDAGLSWGKISTVAWQAEFSFPSEQLGWAAAHSENEGLASFALVRSQDGGRIWAVLRPQIVP